MRHINALHVYWERHPTLPSLSACRMAGSRALVAALIYMSTRFYAIYRRAHARVPTSVPCVLAPKRQRAVPHNGSEQAHEQSLLAHTQTAVPCTGELPRQAWHRSPAASRDPQRAERLMAHVAGRSARDAELHPPRGAAYQACTAEGRGARGRPLCAPRCY